MFAFIRRLVAGRSDSTEENNSDKDTKNELETDWIPVDSEVDEAIVNKRNQQIDQELKSLQKKPSSKFNYSIILREIYNIFIIQKKRVKKCRDITLTADMKYRIFRDVFTELSPKWLERIEEIAPDLAKDWEPSEYEKNILGQMISISDRTSPPKLTVDGLSQTIRSAHLCLINSINSSGQTEISQTQSRRLLRMLLDTSVDRIIDMWTCTVRCSRGTLNQQGRLPLKWLREEAIKQKELNRLKAEEKIDAKYASGETDEIRQQYLARKITAQEISTALSRPILLKQNSFDNRCQELEKIILFRIKY